MNFRIQHIIVIALVSLLSGSVLAETLPEVRPALLGSSRRSLINLIDTESLMKRGQGDAVIMFSAYVSSSGWGHIWETYRATPNSTLLSKEVMGRCSQAQFEPAVYKRQRVAAVLNGTVSFSIVAGKPRLRIFLNQDETHLGKGNDFIAPQLALVAGNPKYEGIWYPGHVKTTPGVAAVTMDIGVTGKVESASVSYEYPTGKGFGAEAVTGLRNAIFIPGFRNGKAVPCRFTFPVMFPGTSRSAKTG